MRALCTRALLHEALEGRRIRQTEECACLLILDTVRPPLLILDGAFTVRASNPVFHLSFPVVDGEAEDLDAGAPVRKDLERLTGTVLVVEDDDSVRQVAGKVLQRAGFEARLVADAEEGLHALAGP